MIKLNENTNWYINSYYMKEMYEVIYLSEKIHLLDGFYYPIIVINLYRSARGTKPKGKQLYH